MPTHRPALSHEPPPQKKRDEWPIMPVMCENTTPPQIGSMARENASAVRGQFAPVHKLELADAVDILQDALHRVAAVPKGSGKSAESQREAVEGQGKAVDGRGRAVEGQGQAAESQGKAVTVKDR